MSSATICLDESGDLGWTLDKPYRRGGSSQHLTIAALITTPEKKHLPKRLIKKLYQKHGWPSGVERKWADMRLSERVAFAEKAHKISSDTNEIKYVAITVKKRNVQEHIRRDPNKLYNYMIRLLLIDEMANFDFVSFVPDPRSIKVQSGNSLHDYLQTILWFDKEVSTILNTIPCDSSCSHNVQFSDMLSGVVQSHFEDGRSQPLKALGTHITCKKLFF